jgi:hypothetical protein
LSGFPERGNSFWTSGHLLRGCEGCLGLVPAIDLSVSLMIIGCLTRFSQDAAAFVRQYLAKIAVFDPCAA